MHKIIPKVHILHMWTKDALSEMRDSFESGKSLCARTVLFPNVRDGSGGVARSCHRGKLRQAKSRSGAY